MSQLIGIDASRAVLANKRGVEYYGWYITKELLASDRKNRYRLYAPYMPKDSLGEYSNVEWKIIPTKRLWSQVHLAKEVRTNRPDVLFVPSHVVPLFSNVKSVVTIHDTAYRYFPESYSTFARQYLDFSTNISIQKARKVLVPSYSTRSDIIKLYKADPKKIVITAEGYNKDVFNPKVDYQSSPIDAPYIFFVGRIESRKNVTLLVDAFALLAKESKPTVLVLAGKPGYGYDLVKQKIDVLPESIRSRIILPGYFPLYDIARYLKYASVFAFPSKYEGFGIPILEAMAMGTPVISSNTPSLKEVASDAAMMLPPENPLSWAAAMSRVLHQKDLAEEMRQKGFEQVKNYSWQKAAKETLEVLEDVAAEK